MSLRAVIIARPGYRELDLWYPVVRLREQGVSVVVAAEEQKE
jgi:putative intracellular protease/amidase